MFLFCNIVGDIPAAFRFACHIKSPCCSFEVKAVGNRKYRRGKRLFAQIYIYLPYLPKLETP
ncbi:MAG: hypothetical protein HC903_12785 [Methylacidiphilales bacterium]|nr:hypothetical protein [Candidatus Methylacidiphilales bacterium]